ncbi:MAG TPA: hypothetical protein VMC61_05760 [Methanocella sp.]|nr:hypothetical protein [Methanocella sp.]
MDSVASAAIQYGSKRTRELFFEPLDVKFIYRSWLPPGSRDPRSRELKRLKPYYRGTRALAWLAILMAVPPFIMPFTSPFIGMGGVVSLLVAYVALFFAINGMGLFVEVGMDPILAIAHEKRISFYKAAGEYLEFTATKPAQAAGYMGAKLIIDTVLLSTTVFFYMPALLVLIRTLLYIVDTLTVGAPASAVIIVLGFFAATVLTVAAALASMFVSVPASAFYGYYTEEALRHMQVA